jgi:DNA-binding transcriptional MerR regulator
MTIKDIESLSGMTRANIRYYEQAGLLSPNRSVNGYRDYSEDDLAILKRIKLLRSLQISLEEIRLLQAGDVELSDTLAKKFNELEQVKRDANYAQEICVAMRNDKITYSTLDAQKYLDRIPRKSDAAEYFSIEADTAPQVFYPWRRFLARMLDVTIYSTFWSALLALVFHVNITNRKGVLDFIDTIMAIIIMLFVEPLLLRFFGTTIGKWVFGLRLEDENGNRPSYNSGFTRTWGVIGSGLGYNIPIYNLVRLWKSCKRCSENEPQPWDDELMYSIKDTKPYRGVLFVGINILIVGAISLILICAQLPPNRGDLTVVEFAENYNTLASYYGINTGKYLNENGQWADNPYDGRVYINAFGSPLTAFEYTTINNYITSIRFEIEISKSQDWLSSSNMQMILSALSFMGAQKEAGIFSNIRSKIPKLINENSFKSFDITQAGIQMNCDVAFSGYVIASDEMLIPEDGAQTHYHMVFSMQK